MDSANYSNRYFLDAWVAWSKKHATLFTHGPTSTAFMLETLIGHLHESLNLSDAPEPSLCKQLFAPSPGVEQHPRQAPDGASLSQSAESGWRLFDHLDPDAARIATGPSQLSLPQHFSCGEPDLFPRHLRGFRRTPTKKSHAKSEMSIHAGKRSPILPCFTGGIEKNYVCAHCLYSKTTIEQFSTLNFKPLALQEVVYIRERFRQRGYAEGLLYEIPEGNMIPQKTAPTTDKPKASRLGFISSIFTKDNQQTQFEPGDNRGSLQRQQSTGDKIVPKSPRTGFLQSLFGKPKQTADEEQVPVLTIRDYLCNLNYTRSPEATECPKCGARAFQAACYTLVRAPTVMVVSFIEPANPDNIAEFASEKIQTHAEMEVQNHGLPDPVKRANEIWHREFAQKSNQTEEIRPNKRISFAPEVRDSLQGDAVNPTPNRSSNLEPEKSNSLGLDATGVSKHSEIQWREQQFKFRVDETFDIDIFSKAVGSK